MRNWNKANCIVFYLGESYRYGENPPDGEWIPLGLVSHDSDVPVFTQFERKSGADIALDEAIHAAWSALPVFYKAKIKGQPMVDEALGAYARQLDKRIVLVYWDVDGQEERMRRISALPGSSEAAIHFEDYFSGREPTNDY